MTQMSPPFAMLPCPLTRFATFLIFLLGFLGVVLLIRLLTKLKPEYNRLTERAQNRLSGTIASRIKIWPLLIFLSWNAVAAITHARHPPATPIAAPALHELLYPVCLHYSLLAIVVIFTCQFSESSWRLLIGSTSRCNARTAVLAGLRGGVMLLLPVWLLSGISNIILETLSWPHVLQEPIEWLASGQLTLPAQSVLLISSIVVAPLAEETLFRGILFPALSQQGTRPWRALLLSSLLFAVLHLHAGSLIPLFGVGIACALGYLATGHLLTPIVMHAFFNTISLLSFYTLSSASAC